MNKRKVYKIKLLSTSHFPEPIYKDDIVIFSDSQEQIFESEKKFRDYYNQLLKHKVLFTYERVNDDNP